MMGNPYTGCPFTGNFLFGDDKEMCARGPEWFETDDFRKWAADKPPEFNAFAYLHMVAEREYANRLEF